MNAREFAEVVGKPHGTVKRWLGEGLPHRKYGSVVVIVPSEAIPWVREKIAKAGGRSRNKVTRRH